MTKPLRTLLCLLLSLVLLGGLCACDQEGAAKPVEGTPIPTYDPSDYDPLESYHLSENEDGRYNYYVTNYIKEVIFSRENEPHAPEFTKLSDSVLQITAPVPSDPRLRWAVFCDVRTQQVSGVFGNFLAAKGDHVAQLEHLTDQYHVFVRNIFDTKAEPTVVTLTGLVADKTGSLYEKVTLNKAGDLEITYTTKSGKKTVTVDMP